MLVVTFATNDQGYFRALKVSCERNGLRLVVLGWKKQWTGYMDKPQAVMRYAQTLDPSEMLIVVDAFDVIILQPEAEILLRYQKITDQDRNRVVVGIDNVNGSLIVSKLLNLIFRSSCYSRNINTGVMIGPASTIAFIFKSMCANAGSVTSDDQKIFNQLCSKLANKITVDDSGDIIFTSCVFRSPGPRPLSRNGKSPCIVHAPGLGDMNELCRRLNLPIARPRDETGEKRKFALHLRNHGRQGLRVCFIALLLMGMFLFISYVFLSGRRNRHCRYL